MPATAGPAYCRMCSTDVYCSKQTGSSSTKETITHHFFVSGIGQKKTVDAAKICGGAENVVKTKPANIRKWIAPGFITLGIYTPPEAQCVYTTIAWVAHRYGQLIYAARQYASEFPSSCFIVIQPL